MEIKKEILAGIKEAPPMRDILHKTTAILHGRGKVITLREHADENDCVTDVRKKNWASRWCISKSLLTALPMMKDFLSG